MNKRTSFSYLDLVEDDDTRIKREQQEKLAEEQREREAKKKKRYKNTEAGLKKGIVKKNQYPKLSLILKGLTDKIKKENKKAMLSVNIYHYFRASLSSI